MVKIKKNEKNFSIWFYITLLLNQNENIFENVISKITLFVFFFHLGLFEENKKKNMESVFFFVF